MGGIQPCISWRCAEALWEVLREGEARVVDTRERLRRGYTARCRRHPLPVKCFSSFNVQAPLGDYRHRHELILLGGLGFGLGSPEVFLESLSLTPSHHEMTHCRQYCWVSHRLSSQTRAQTTKDVCLWLLLPGKLWVQHKSFQPENIVILQLVSVA